MLKWMRCASYCCIRNNETASQVFQSKILMCSSRRGFEMLQHLISWTLPGSFIGEQTLLYLLVPLCFNNVHVDSPHGKEMKESHHKICGTFSQGKTWDVRHGEKGDLRGVIETQKECFKKRRCYWESWNHLINQERETELSPAAVQSKPEQLWVLRGGPNPLVAPPGAWKPGGESPFVHTKATLTRFHCDKKWEGCFVGLKNSQQEVRIRCPFIFQALH